MRAPSPRRMAAHSRRTSSCAERTHTSTPATTLAAAATKATLKYPITTWGGSRGSRGEVPGGGVGGSGEGRVVRCAAPAARQVAASGMQRPQGIACTSRTASFRFFPPPTVSQKTLVPSRGSRVAKTSMEERKTMKIAMMMP